MTDRLLNEIVPRIPCARAPVQSGQFFLAIVCLRTLLQQILEQVMKAIPPLARIEGDQKEIRALQPVQSGLHLFVRDIASHDLGTQFCAELR